MLSSRNFPPRKEERNYFFLGTKLRGIFGLPFLCIYIHIYIVEIHLRTKV